MYCASILNRRSPGLAGGVEVYYTEEEYGDTACLIHLLMFLSEYQTAHHLSVRAMPTVVVNDVRSTAKKVLAIFSAAPRGELEIRGMISVQFANKNRDIFRAYLDQLGAERSNTEMNPDEMAEIAEEDPLDVQTLYEAFLALKDQYFPDPRMMH